MNCSVNLQRASHVLGLGQLSERGKLPCTKAFPAGAEKNILTGNRWGAAPVSYALLCPIARCLPLRGKPRAASEPGTDWQRLKEGVWDQRCRASC